MEDILYTVSETAKLIKTNPNYVYELIKQGLLPALKLGSLKIRRSSLLKFLAEHEGQDLTDLNNIKELKVS
jgi:excisionase family DNA binding protein